MFERVRVKKDKGTGNYDEHLIAFEFYNPNDFPIEMKLRTEYIDYLRHWRVPVGADAVLPAKGFLLMPHAYFTPFIDPRHVANKGEVLGLIRNSLDRRGNKYADGKTFK